MSEDKPIYLINFETDPIIIKIRGRASYLNCAPLRKFMSSFLVGENCRIVVDFKDCIGMDSTFLGLLAGSAMDIRKKCPDGYLKLCRLNERNMELVSNLGLHRLMSCTCEALDFVDTVKTQVIDIGESTIVSKQAILEAHERLIEADANNLAKFEDVVTFLKKQVEEG